MDNFIKDFWENQAKEFKGHHKASWGDEYALELEFELISSYLVDGQRVLDVGCANGFAAIAQAKRNKINLTGIDFSKEMIKYSLQNKKIQNAENVSFFEGDITNIEFEDNSFDIVYTTRVLINLQNWELQKKGIRECLRVTKQGGKVILLEAFYEPMIKLNGLRLIAGLDPLEEHDFNRYLKKKKLENLIESLNLKFFNIDFSSVYYLGSRFLRELVTDYKLYEGYSNPINYDFFKLEKEYSGGGFGIQQAYIINK
jgi:ubiquinone/menaquinone biosynthesis C-methylase UbiE